MLAQIYVSLVLAVLAVGAMSLHGPQIVLPPKGSVIAPNTDFEFQFHSIADYGISSYNFTCWLYTSPPRFFEPSDTFAVGHYLGRFSQSNYPANTYPV
ncbi:hypothetical protein C8R47DRAFT_646627 [Mycena vitilis]|nr:hypothetical protein C8R47DRAFT_646627 [Mycena vitilis]